MGCTCPAKMLATRWSCWNLLNLGEFLADPVSGFGHAHTWGRNPHA
jgi:hypothetical protein